MSAPENREYLSRWVVGIVLREMGMTFVACSFKHVPDKGNGKDVRHVRVDRVDL